jgi:hypothetical protein
VAVGTLLARTSPDGATWTGRTTAGSDDMKHVCWTGSQFVAVGYRSVSAAAIQTSPDGITWSSQTAGFSEQLNSVCV